ncbi:hypothetical protein GF420_15345 [candidate division GN15 bacterium]|nr:hypothetical protein [candidate division GN15 bacterium]
MKIALIGGTGRSGTSILTKLFSRHPAMCNVPEWRFLVDPDGLLDFYSSVDAWTPYVYDRRLKRLDHMLRVLSRRHPLWLIFAALHRWDLLRLSRWNLRAYYAGINTVRYCPDFKRLSAELIDKLNQFRYRGYWIGLPWLEKNELRYHYFPDKAELASMFGEFLRSVMQSVLDQQHAEHYLEKNTWNILWLDKILELLPEARMVHIYRDPRDVVASYTKQSWMPSDPAESAVIYRDLLKQWWLVRDRVPEESYLEISLEALVSETEPTLHRICDFWQVSWSDELLKTDLSRAHSGRWKRDFNDRQQAAVQEILAESISALGYE